MERTGYDMCAFYSVFAIPYPLSPTPYPDRMLDKMENYAVGKTSGQYCIGVG